MLRVVAGLTKLRLDLGLAPTSSLQGLASINQFFDFSRK